jgi:density-regulated protein DRP1
MATLSRKSILYCGECGMPPEYCEYGPDYETNCIPWLKSNHREEYDRLRAATDDDGDDVEENFAAQKPTAPWTTEERLINFYEKYQPDKVDGAGAILEKYAGKEDKLFKALVKKYGSEPEDPYYADSDDDESGNELGEEVAGMSLKDKKKKRRGAAAKKSNEVDTRIIISKNARNRKKAVTSIVGMDTVPDIKLKDVSKACSKQFAGSSSVKDLPSGKKEIIIQGDHMDDVAAMIVKKFKVPAEAVYLDIEGEFVPFKRE